MAQLTVDPEYAAFLAAQQTGGEPTTDTEPTADTELPAVGDIEGRREAFKALLGTGEEPFDETEVTITDHAIPVGAARASAVDSSRHGSDSRTRSGSTHMAEA